MRTGLVLCVLLAISLCGCARGYVMTMQNGRRITTASKPRLKEGYYVFKDAQGKPVYIAAGRVREIAPVGMATEGSSREFKAGPGQR